MKYITYIKTWTLALVFTVFAGGSILAVAAPQTVSALAADCAKPLLTFPVWYRGLVDDNCNIVSPGDAPGGLSNFIWHIVLNVIEIGLQLVVYIAAIFILFAGFQFLTSGGDPAKAAKSRNTILNAAIGLVISIGSIAIVNLIVRIIS